MAYKRECPPGAGSIEIAKSAIVSTNYAIPCDTRTHFLQGRRTKDKQYGVGNSLVRRHRSKTLRLVRISLLISAIQRVLCFFSGNLFYKSNRKLFYCVCIAWYKHSRRWENSRQLCKPETSSQVCITVSNSPNPFRVYIRLCKHAKRFLLLKQELASWVLSRTYKNYKK